MDFHKMLQKLDSINPVEKTAVASSQSTQQPKVVLAEDAQMRVLAGVSSILEEGRKAKDETVKEATKADKSWTDKSGKSHTGTAVKGKAYGGSSEEDKEEDSDEADEKAAKKAAKKGVEESTAAQKAARSKFQSMVEAKKEESDKKKDAKKKKMAEGGLPMTTVNGKKVPAFAADGKGKNDLGKGKDTEADDSEESGEEKDGKKGMSDKQAKYFGKKTESAMMPKGKKRPVKESVQQKYSFKQCLQLVKESGGQQQIDPVDGALWKWAQRVAVSKVQEGVSADAMAAFVYERMGGEFQLFDVLSETK